MIDDFESSKNRFLSNFYLCEIEFEGLTYPSTEHAYQSAKTLHFVLRKAFTWDGFTPAETKKLSRTAPIRSDWDVAKDDVMLRCLRAKFQIPELAKMLLATGSEELVEGNTWGDVYWGVCNGKGLNKLGKMLMQVRDEIQP